LGVKDVGVGLMRDSASFAGTSRWLRRLSHESRRLIGTGAKEKFPCQGREIPAKTKVSRLLASPDGALLRFGPLSNVRSLPA